MMLTKLVFVCAHLLIILQCQNIYSDQVPIVYFQQNIWLFKFGDGTYQGSQTIDYSAKSFKQVPVVILGISFYNNYWNPNTGVDFVLSATQITTNSCIVQTSRLNNSILVGISVNALVIDTSQFPFFIKTDKKIQQIVFNNYVNEQTYSFSSSILNQTNKNVSAILTGWTLTYDSSNQVFALTIQVSSITNTGYNIKISTAQNSQKIVNVYFTIIEYVQNPDSSLYGIVSNYDTQYQYPTNKNCFFNSTCSNSDRFFPVQFNVFIQNNSPSNVNYLNFFVSINQIYFNTIQNGQDLRISITNQPLSSNQIQYQYSIWDGSQCLGTTSTALYFYQKLCANSQFVLINNNNNCSTVCQNQDPSDSSVCLDCPTGQYLLLDQKVCQQTQPIGYFCSDPNQVPFVYQKQGVRLFAYGEPSLQGQQIIDYSSKQFQQKPIVVVGINFFNNQWSAPYVDFIISSKQITISNCVVYANRNNNSILYGISVSVLVLDTSQFPYFNKIDDKITGIQFDNNYVYKKSYQFQSNLLNQGIKNVSVVLTGWAYTFNSAKSVLALTIQATDITDSGYTITITTDQKSQVITNVYFTILEYIQNPPKSIYGLISNYDTQYQYPTTQKCFSDTSCNNSQRYFTVSFNVLIQNSSPSTSSYSNFFVSINQFYFTTQVDGQDQRINIVNKPLSLNTIQYQYQIWDGTQCQGTTSTALYFYIKTCPVGQLLNTNSNTCSATAACQIKSNSQICLDCSQGQNFVQDQNTCQTNQPIGYWCSIPNQQYNFNVCQNCSISNYQVPFVYQKQGVRLFEYGENQLQGYLLIDYSDKLFQQTPIVVVGIDFFNNLWNAPYVDFIISSQSITNSYCTVSATKNNNSILYGISVSFLVLDTSQFPYFNKIDDKITGIQFDNNDTYKKQYQFSPNLQNQGIKNVSVILTGWAYSFNPAKSVLALTIQATDITDTGYTITITTDQNSQVITNVYFTILEYIQNPPKSIYGIISNYDTQYQYPTTQQCFYDTSCNNSQRYFTVSFNILIQNSSPSTSSYSNFFVSINQFYFKTQADSQDQRINIANKPLSSNTVQYQYQIWDGAQCYGTTSTALYFYIKTCPVGQLVNTNSKTCSATAACQIKSNSQICLDCSQGQYFVQDQNICQTTQPVGYWCSIPNQQYNFNVCQNWVQLRAYGNSQLQGTQTVDYSSKSFQQIPIVIVGIDFFNNIWNAPHGVDFIISSNSITNSDCVVQVTTNNNSDLAGISVSVLVLDTSQFPFFNKIDVKITGIQFDNNYVYKKKYQFSSNLQNQGQKNVNVILTGWAYTFNPAKSVLALTIQATDITDSGYTITITTDQSSQVITNVYFTILEYIQNPPKSIYGIISNYDTQYQYPTTQNCFYDTSCDNSQRYFTVSFNVLIQNSSPSTSSYSNFFVSINQFYFKTQMNGQDQRINIVNKPLSANTIQYQYQIWDGAQCYGITSTALYFYIKTCPVGQLVNTNINTCSTTAACQIQFNSQICLDCSQGQYFVQDQNICSTTQPIGYWCSIPNSQYNFNVCQNCSISNCKQCSQNSDKTFKCTQCISQYFLYNNQCYQAQNFFQNLAIIYTNFFIVFKCQIAFSDQVPFVYQQQGVKLFAYGDGSLSGSQTIDYSSKSFQQTPIVIVGIDFFNNFWNAPHGVDFIISSNSITKSNCEVKATRNNNGNSDLVGISVSVLVLDTSQFPFFNKIDVKITGIQFDINYVYKKQYQFSSNLQNQGQKNVNVILTGWAYTFNSAKSVLALTIQATDITDSGYTITITTDQNSQVITNVYFAILEYIQNPPKSIYGIISNYDTQYQYPTTQNCFYDTSCDNSQRYFTVSFNVLIQNSSPSTSSYSNFFVSINQFYFKTQADGQDQRINIVNKPLSANTIQYQYQIWDGAQCYGTTSTALYFYIKTCPVGQLVNTNINTCSTTAACQIQFNTQICLDCSQGQYFVQDQNICQTTQPIGYWCSIPNQQYNFNVCQNCSISNCKNCTQNSDKTFKCIQCISQYFLYNNECYQVHFLDKNNNCTLSCAKKDCLLCLNEKQCDKYSDNRIYSGNQCDYSCSQCQIPNKNYGCTQCSSSTRQLEKITGSCFCKDGYSDVGTPDCKDDNALKPYQQIQATSDNFLQALYILYLPQLFINIHPFTDYLIFQMQSLGNLYFVNQNNTQILYKSFVTLNFVNIYYQSSAATSENVETILGIKYKLIIDKIVSQNLILLAVLLQKLDFSSKNFKKPPKVVVGIGFYNNRWNPNDKDILFELTSSSITVTDCIVELKSDNNSSYLYGIQANVFVIDTSQFPFFDVIDQSQKGIKFDANCNFQEKRTYSPSLSGSKNAIVVIRGWKSPTSKSQQINFSLTVNVTNVDDQNYIINITTNKQSYIIEDVYYTIIEYVKDPAGNFGILSNYDVSFQAPTKEKCFSDPYCDQRNFQVDFKVVSMEISQQNGYKNFFASINQFEFQTNSWQDPRIKLTEFNFNKDTIQYSYNIWDTAVCNGSTSSSLFFYRKFCKDNKVIDLNNCSSKCIIQDPQNNQQCLDCPSGQYLLLDKKTCQAQQPINYACKKIESFNSCENCNIKNCQDCSQISNQFVCDQCNDKFYLFQNQCVQDQPPNSYCDKFLKCQSCSDLNCKTCSDPKQSNQECLSCFSNEILYNQKCYKKENPPNNTYCDWINSFKCKECTDKFCDICDDKNQCQSCILCQDNSSCDKYSEERIYQNQDCHFSCSKCYLPNKDYGCQECSSNTRQLQKMTGSCTCKTGYSEIGAIDCQDDNTIKPNYKIQDSSNKIVEVLFLAYLPQLFINIHPYTDYFIFQMQSLGNIYFVNQNSTLIPFKSFTILNYFNIYYESSNTEENNTQTVFGIKFKLIIDKLISQNLLLLAITLAISTIFSSIVFLFRKKITSKFIITTFLWNCQVKLIRISSNYFLINLFLNLRNFSEQEQLSFIILGILGSIYILNLVICFLKSKNIDRQNFKFLYDNLDTNNTFNRYFWMILEFKKIICILCLSFAPLQVYYYIFMGITFLFGMVLVKFKPHLNSTRDCAFLVISELFTFILSILVMLMQQINDFSQICTFTNLANITTIIYVVFQFLSNLEYILRKFIQYKRQKSRFLSSQNTNKPNVVDMALEINVEKLDDILNQSRMVSSYFRPKPTSKNDVPFVYYQQNIFLFKLDDNSFQGSQTINYVDKQFKNIPIVILGIDFYNNYWNAPQGVDFVLQSTDITTTSCLVFTERKNNSNLVGISASALVIDISQFPFFNVNNYEKINIQFTNYEYSEYYNFKPNLLNQGYKNVSVVLTGWKSNYDYQDYFALTIEATNITDSGYTIKISTAQSSQTILSVYFTVLEYVYNPPSFFGIVSNYDTLYKQKTNYTCFYTPSSCPNNNRYFPVQLNVFIEEQVNSYISIFASINQFYFTTQSNKQDLRISIQNLSQNQNIIHYYYFIWDGAICQGTTSTALHFYKKICPNGQLLNINGNICTSQCKIQSPQNSQICLDCLPGQYFLQDQKICQTTQPAGYSCSIPNGSQFNVCEICGVSNCKECQNPQCTQYENNNCSQKCPEGCLLCLNSFSCDQYSDNRVYSGNECDFSCSKCTLPNKRYGCTECSSKTRKLDKITGSCFCKDGYSEVGTPDCQDNNALKPQQQIQKASDGILQALFILYLPQLFINVHPFSDYFIFQMQSLGNLYIVNQNNTQILYKSFATLNFVNIYYESSEANIENSSCLGKKQIPNLQKQIFYGMFN
ncbi:hypothetical protein ABPG74_009534 [Tetrahymena malaccensis]